ncbi:hypothetical protein PYW07_004925 [Mythimna separata]|uniref:Uncharacterized protein n=1 Tax=Mythimna separata TaxID=271217 RepID=A0AAD7YEJ9_MYTSE|nr:hypothetical protein PYW07_004925 [Mythimna separata]
MLKAVGGKTCPYPPGIYDLKNLSIPYVPKNFPFTKGRIYCNVTLTEGGVTRTIGRGCIDVEMSYFDTERPVVDWYDKTAFRYFILISKRLNRQDPRHYVEVRIHTLFTMSNKFKLDFYFYQFLTNRYRPSFVEMHLPFCDMMQSDTIFGPTMLRAMGDKTCPYPPVSTI